MTAGDIVVIKPGESIPVDGVITEGGGYVDQSAITGESIPVEKNVGDNVISATINKNGSFKFKASKVGNDTTLAHIIRPGTRRRRSRDWPIRSAGCLCRR